MAENLPLPKKRDLFFTKQVDQSSIGELTQKIIEINQDDEHLKKIYNVYGLTYNPEPIQVYIDSYVDMFINVLDYFLLWKEVKLQYTQ